MLVSEPFPFTLRRERCKLYVVRNSGFCWAVVAMPNGHEVDVFSARDVYECRDEDAAAYLIGVARRKLAAKVTQRLASPPAPTRISP
jgi:hypothetical protein